MMNIGNTLIPNKVFLKLNTIIYIVDALFDFQERSILL